jgi:photosystem II stability/assembly factor-like uncharacterized protein
MKIYLITFTLFIFLFSNNIYSQWSQQHSGANNRLLTCFFLNENVGWAAGYNGTILKTTDGGVNWNSQSLITADDIHSIFFIDSSNGWLVLYEFSPDRHGIIMRTTDGGETWVNQLMIWGFTLHRIYFTDINNGYALGSNGILYKTSNGGQNWNEISPFYSYWLYSAFFFNPDVGWVGGGLEGSFLRTTNGGQSWSWIGLPTTQRIMDIVFTSENFGWACGAGGKIIRTTNYGLDWSLGNSGVNVELRDIQFLDQFQGWSVGLNGVILHTFEGGINLYQQISGTSNNLYSTYFADSLIGYAVGDNGIILKTNNGGIPVELINFTAHLLESEIVLEWTTATETNNSGFEIERKSDTQVWLKIGFIPGHGTTTEKQNYQFTDRPEDAGEYFYRLKQIDFDGSFEYSNEVNIEFIQQFTFALGQNYPNPFNPTTTITFSIPEREVVTLKIYNSLGEIVGELANEEKESGNYEFDFDASELPSGIYFYTLTSGKFIKTNKMILLK